MLRRVSRFAGAKRFGDQSRLHGHVHAGDTKGLWGSYLRFLGTRPISAGLATGFTLWTIGDCAAQRLDPTKPFDIRRALATGVFGGVVAGAVASEWYRLLEYLATHVLALRPGSWRFVAFKLGLEFVLWHPFSLITFWFTVGLIDGRDVKAIRAEVSEEFRPTILTEYALWAPLDFVNFWKVPVKYQVAVVNLGCFVESVMLSYIHENGFPKIFGDGHADLPVAAAPIIPELGANNKYGDKPSRVLAWQRAIRPSGISSKFGKKFADIQKQIDKEWPRGDLTRQEVERVMRGEASLPGLRNDALSVTCSAILYRKMEAEGRDTVAKDSYVRFIKAFQESGFRMKVLAEVCFALFDADNDGYLDEGEMRNLVSVVTGQSMDGLAVHQLMQQVSTSTRLSKQDFVELVTASTQNTTTPA